MMQTLKTLKSLLMCPARHGACAAALALASWLPTAANAAPVTLDFNDLATTDLDVLVGNSYTRNGFVLSTDSTFGFIVIGPGLIDSYAGSAGLLAWGGTGNGGAEAPGTLQLQRADGGVFDFNGLSLGAGSAYVPADVTFKGFDALGRLVNSITVPGASIGVGQFNAIDFDDRFLGVSRVSWQQSGVAWQAHQVDDVRLDQVTAVPEPGSLGLFGVGLLTLCARRRWRAA